jgi:hypothetical protein
MPVRVFLEMTGMWTATKRRRPALNVDSTIQEVGGLDGTKAKERGSQCISTLSLLQGNAVFHFQVQITFFAF